MNMWQGLWGRETVFWAEWKMAFFPVLIFPSIEKNRYRKKYYTIKYNQNYKPFYSGTYNIIFFINIQLSVET